MKILSAKLFEGGQWFCNALGRRLLDYISMIIGTERWVMVQKKFNDRLLAKDEFPSL